MAKPILNIQRQSIPTITDAYNNLLGIKDDNHFVNLPLSLLDEEPEQPFPINEDKVTQIADSIENVGVLEPLIVVRNNDRYKILSGRHRFRACSKLGKTEIPCYIKDVSEDVARYILIATNTDRNNEYAPSVYAKAYAEQMELMKKLGKKTVSSIAEQNGVSRKQIYRYVRLTYLNDTLMQWVDDGSIAFLTGVELSYLNAQQQDVLLDFTNKNQISRKLLTLEVGQRFHKVISNYENSLDEFENDVEKIFFNEFEETSNDEPINEKPIKNEPVTTEEPVSTKETVDTTEPEPTPEQSLTTSESKNSFNDELIKGYMVIALEQAGIKAEKSKLDEILANYSAFNAVKAYKDIC